MFEGVRKGGQIARLMYVDEGLRRVASDIWNTFFVQGV